MGTNKFSGKQDKKEERDAAIGRALSNAIKESAGSESCPSNEDISAFLDGRLDEKQRDALMGHLSHCDGCYEVFSMAQEMANEKKEEVVREKKKSWIYAPIAIAAAVVLVILIRFVVPILSPYSPPSSSHIVATLAKNADAKSLSSSIRDEYVIAYGFGSGIPLEKASFRIGVCLTDLGISLMAEDKPKSLAVAKRLISTLQSVDGPVEVVSFYTDVSKKIEEGAPPKEFLEKNKKIEQFFKDKEVLLYLRFGEWVEGGRLAAISKDKEFFDVKSIQYFINNFEGKNLPQGIFTSLNETKGILVRDKITEKDFKQIEMVLTNIIEMM